jgi:uncharacterized protein VirK/YbjX
MSLVEASREDVLACYRTILGREPENETVIAYHLSHSSTVWTLVRTFIHSDEFMTRHANGRVAKLLLDKKSYLAKNISKKLVCDCYFHNFSYMCRNFSESSFEDVMCDEITLLQLVKNDDVFDVVIRLSAGSDTEGELSLEFKFNGEYIFTTSFSIIPGSLFNLAQENVILISRMQGKSGKHSQFQKSTKAFGDISPQMVLLCALNGIAKSMACETILGVSATNQLSYTLASDLIHRKTYDDFYLSLGSKRMGNNFFVVEALLKRYGDQHIKPSHRNRTRKRRRIKADIVELTARTWSRVVCGQLELAEEAEPTLI